MLGQPLARCPSRHPTGYYRDGFCHAGPDDQGLHGVCARVTEGFLRFTGARGNDLVHARGTFPGLRDGDFWCLCAARWQEAFTAGVAPPVYLAATDERSLAATSLAALRAHALDGPGR